MSGIGFFNQCVDLFVSALSAVLAQPVLSAFAASACLLAVVALFGWAVRSAKRL